MINFRENWRGHLWQGRFSSFPMDETYLLTAARYVEMNPVRARLTPEAALWPWSSARAHLEEVDDRLVKVKPLLEIAGDWHHFLEMASDEEKMNDLRRHEGTGRPVGTASFLARLESLLDRTLTRRKPGPKRKHN